MSWDLVKTENSKVKVLFVLNGLTHYFNKVLNRLNSLEELEIVTLVPSKGNKSLGTGVYTTMQEVEFKVYTLPEKKRFYGKLFFDGFINVIEKENPQIIVVIWPYILEFVFNPIILMRLRKRNIKIFYKDIPFQLPKFRDGLRLMQSEVWTEEEGLTKTTKLYRINLFFVTIVKWYIYKIVDINLNYVNEAYDLLNTYGVHQDKIFVTFNSPDTDVLLEAYEEAKRRGPLLKLNNYRIITVGRLVRWKRVDLLIRTFKILINNYKDLEVIIIGTGPEEKNLKKLAGDLDIERYIKFEGSVYDPVRLGQYYLSSQIFVQPGMGGLAINEAMCFEKPIICSFCDGTEKDLVREGFNGLYFKVGDTGDLANKIKYLFDNPQLVKAMGLNSLSIIKNEINIHTVVDRYRKAFNSLSNVIQ